MVTELIVTLPTDTATALLDTLDKDVETNALKVNLVKIVEVHVTVLTMLNAITSVEGVSAPAVGSESGATNNASPVAMVSTASSVASVRTDSVIM